jgi:phytoene desaturase
VRTVSGPTDRVVVVGAGLAGLSAALRLAGAGREVTVIERHDQPGGVAGRLRLDGYVFDTGPTVFTMPDLLADTLGCVGESLEDWLDLVPLSPVYRGFFPDGERLDIFADVDATAAEIARLAGSRDADGYRRLVGWLTALYRVQRRDFIDRNLDSALDLLRPSLAKLVALGGLRRLDPAVRRFIRDPRVRRMFTFQALYAGLSPYRALALYAVISYLDTVNGVSFPRGGMHEVPLALAGAAAKHGVTFRYGTTASKVELAGGRARAVHTADGERLTADAVVLAGDLPGAYRNLLADHPTPGRVERLRPAPSCVVLNVGASAHYPQTAHHNVHFGQSWRTTFDELIGKHRLMSDPSLLVTNPSRTDPAMAPDGRQSYYVLAPAPNAESGLDWSVVGPRYRDELVATLHARGYTGFGDAVEVERLVTPADWAADGLTAGTPFAAAHTPAQTGPFRSANLVPGLDNVVFAGGWTTPGVGVPMVMISGRLAAERIVGAGSTRP